MKRRRFIRDFSRTLALGVSGSWSTPGFAASGRLVVIVAPQAAVTELSLGTLKRIFLAQTVERPGGGRYVPFNHPPNTLERTHFDQVVLEMSPDQVARYWVDQRIRGNSGAPRAIASSRLLKRVVARMPGAIGYITVSELDDTVRPLKLNGFHYNHKDYPLK